MTRGITKRQEAVLRFVVECIRDNGLPPTMAEIGGEFGITSTNGVSDHLLALEKKGYIERTSKARGIRVTPKAAAGLYQNDAAMIPLVGYVAAGTPLLAEENVEDHIAVSSSLAGSATYCLRVTGDSMIEDGMLDGDIVVVDQQRRARIGDVVVALIDGEATVKHYHPNGAAVELRPANSSMVPVHCQAEELQLQGVVVALQRSL